MYKHLFSKFLKANEGKRHFACHSHHFWPDCTQQAQLDYWEDSAKYTDDKWEFFFTHKIPEYQKELAEVLSLSNPEQITIAPNTHELVYRLLSSLGTHKLKVLTTDSEFYSFARQLDRLEEEGLVEVTKIPTEPFNTFEERFLDASENKFDLVYFDYWSKKSSPNDKNAY